MEKNIKTFFNSKFIKWFVIPVILLYLWLVLTMLYMAIYDNSFLVLGYNHSETSFHNLTHERLKKGEKIKGEFIAQEDNLGIVAIRFKQFLRIPYKDEDTLVFRIKQKGAAQWYSQNKYKSGLTFDVPFLPFGFPVIADSKGKTYMFELESLSGNEKNGVVISDRWPNLVSKYQSSKSMLLSDKKELKKFISKKLYTSFQSIDILFSSFIYLLPLVLYIVYISPLRDRFLKRTQFLLGRIPIVYPALLILFLIFVDIFFFQVNNDSLYIVCMLLWIALLKLHNQSGKYSFVFGILFFIFVPILYFLDSVIIALKANTWAYMLLVAGLLQMLFELKKNKKVSE